MKKVLIVEDDELLSRVLKNRFAAAGWDVVSAENGSKAMEVLKAPGVDVVILDLILPQKSGFEILRELRSGKVNSKLPVIVVSNLGTEADVKKALALGANDYFVKTQHPLTEIIAKAEKYTAAAK
jgi:DNA-binding response OmpR family regulator